MKLKKSPVFPAFCGAALLAFGTMNTPLEAQDSPPDPTLAALVQVLDDSSDTQFQLDVLRGLSDAVKGKREVAMPQGWEQLEEKLGKSAHPQVRFLTQSLGLTFGSQRALEHLRSVVRDRSSDLATRRAALDSLLSTRDPGLPQLLRDLLADPALRGQAIRGLARFDTPGTADAILSIYTDLNATEKRDALNTLASRAAYAEPLLKAVANGSVPKNELTAEIVRQVRNLKNPKIDELVTKVWGAFRDSSEDKLKEIERYIGIYRAGGSQPGDAIRGRAVYARTCQQCHTLFGVGGTVGPDITGSNRGDLQYILENIVDPNAVIPNDYRSSTVITKDDRVLTGIVKKEDQNSITVATANETLVIPKAEIDSVTLSEISMMPEGLLAPLNDQEVRDLVYYLRGPGQVPLLGTPETVAYFYNGKDLAGWDGNEDLWSVEDGEIVGRTEEGLKHNEFLKSSMILGDFRLVCQVKLTPNKENSGIQFRSEPLANGEVKGYQADIGQGWWGKLYEEEGRGLLWDKAGDQNAKPGEWNTYEIVAVGNRIRTAVNGKLCVDLEDPKGATQGVVAFQLHSGGPMEVRFKDLHVEANPKFELKTVKK